MLSILVCHSYFLRFDQKQQERAKPYPPLATLQVAAHAAQRRPRSVVFRRHAGRRLHALRAPARCPQAAARAALRGQLQFPEQDVPGPHARGLPRDDRPGTRARRTHHRRRVRCLRCAGQLSRCRRRRGAARRGARRARGARRPAQRQHSRARRACARGRPARCEHRRRAGPNVRHSGAAPLPEPNARRALPAWDLVDVEKYRRVWRRAHGYFSLNMAASRGCSFRCNWCAKPIWGNQYLQRPPREIAAEMLYLRRHYRPDHIWFADDIFGFQAPTG